MQGSSENKINASAAALNSNNLLTEQTQAMQASIQDLCKDLLSDQTSCADLAGILMGTTTAAQLMKVSPDWIDCAYGKGLAAYQEQKYRQALPFFVMTFLLDSKYLAALRGMAGCLQALGDHQRAVQFYLSLLAFNEFDFEAIVCMSASLEGMGKPAVVTDVLHTLIETPEYQKDASVVVKQQVEQLLARCKTLAPEQETQS